MKQGHATHSNVASTKTEPVSQGIMPGHVGRMGNMVGDHADCGYTGVNSVPMYAGRGLKAPMVGETQHHSGSQGKHK